jgi:hypothetical protein
MTKVVTLLLLLQVAADAFVPSHRSFVSRTILPVSPEFFELGDDGTTGKGENWIERTFPVDFDGSQDGGARQLKKVEDYDLGISGKAFQTGPLSARMYDAIIKTNANIGMSPEVKLAYKVYAMDFTAREATRAALTQNGLQMALEDEDMDQGMWGDLDSIQLLDARQKPFGPMYDSLDDVVQEWTPGQSFSFVVRNVPAKIRELTLDELMSALDPKGENTEQAKQAGVAIPFEEIRSLKDLANDNVRRTEAAPRGATDEANAYSGKDERGYRVISRSDLLLDSIDADGSENQKSKFQLGSFLRHSLVTHSSALTHLLCLLQPSCTSWTPLFPTVSWL